MSIKKILVNKINNSDWWHVSPIDPNAYKKRGVFLASTFLQASFYGRPNNEPSKIRICNPIYGFSEEEILIKLFGKSGAASLLGSVIDNERFYKTRVALDAKMRRRAQKLGYDAIALMTPSGKNTLRKKRKPNSIELNLINI